MRFETHKASAYLVWKLKAAGVDVLVDGGDIILVETNSGRASIHLIESFIPLYEIRSIMQQNEKDGLHTLFIFWSDVLLPRDGWYYEPDDWMQVLLALHNGKIYGYETYGAEVFIFPVYFEGPGDIKDIRHGPTIEATYLHFHTVETGRFSFEGTWHVADFASRPEDAAWWHRTDRSHQADGRKTAPPASRLSAFYAVLGLERGAHPDEIKKQYRLLARRYHPDLNASADATEKMQQINAAYQTIIQALEDDAN